MAEIDQLVEQYSKYLANWEDQTNEEIRRGVEMLNHAESLGYILEYVGDGIDVNGNRTPSKVIAKEIVL